MARGRTLVGSPRSSHSTRTVSALPTAAARMMAVLPIPRSTALTLARAATRSRSSFSLRSSEAAETMRGSSSTISRSLEPVGSRGHSAVSRPLTRHTVHAASAESLQCISRYDTYRRCADRSVACIRNSNLALGSSR